MTFLTQPRTAPSDRETITVIGRSTSRGSSRRQVHAAVLVTATTSAIAAALLSTASPVEVPLIDALYRSAFAFSVVWFASRSRRWTWMVIAGFATVSASSLALQAISLVALAIAAWTIVARRRLRWVGAVVAGLAMVVLLLQGQGPFWRLTLGRVDDPFGTSAVVTLLAVAPIMCSGWKSLSRKRRSRLTSQARRLGATLGVIVIVSGAMCAIAVPSLTNGLEETRNGATFAAAGDLDAATLSFAAANEEWDQANALLSGPWMVPSRLVPVLGQHIRAAQVVSGQASGITDSATTVTARISPDQLIIDGAVNITETDAITPVVDAFAATIERAALRMEAVNSPWLVAPVGASIDRSEEILTPAAGVVSASAEALHVVNALLGGPTPSEILVMFSTPAEARGSGGFIGNWAVVSGADGTIEIVEQYRTRELNELLEVQDATLPTGTEFAERYGQFNIERHIQDVTISPDFPAVAEVTASLFGQATGTNVEAIVMIDPFVIEQLLQFSGPIAVDGSSATLTSTNVLDTLFLEQYEQFEDAEADREAALSGLVTTLLTELLDNPPDPLAFAAELAPLAEENRIAMWWRADADGVAVERLGLDGAFPTSDGDLLALVHQNLGQNKIDSFLTRETHIETTLDQRANRIDHQLFVTLENAAPATGLPDAVIGSNDQGFEPGTNVMLLTLYSEVPVVGAVIEDAPVPIQRATEFGVHATTFILAVPSQSSVVLDISLSGELDLSDGYQAVLGAQPLIRPDLVTWEIRTADEARLTTESSEWAAEGTAINWDARLEQDRDFSFAFDR